MKRKGLSFLSAAMILIGICGCAKREVWSKWTEVPLTVDGRSDDWAGFVFEEFQEGKIQLGLKNDQDNLYILLLLRDESLAKFLHRKGATIWFDKSSHKKKDFGIRYPGSPLSGEELRSSFWRSLTDEQKERLREKRAEMSKMITVIERSSRGRRLIPSTGESGPAASYTYRKGDVYTCEFKIPLGLKTDDNYALSVKPGDEIELCLELASREGGGRRGMGNSMEGRMRGGGMRRARRHAEGRRGHKGPGGVRPPEKTEIWMAVILATELMPTSGNGF